MGSFETKKIGRKKKKEQQKAGYNGNEEKIKRIWQEICNRVNQTVGTTNNYAERWILVREFILKSQEGKKLTVADQKINQMLNDEIYYQSMRYFTFEFDFLMEYPEIAKGGVGRKIIDKESARKYIDLRIKVQQGKNEKERIQELLKDPETDETDKRILKERLAVIVKKELDYQYGTVR